MRWEPSLGTPPQHPGEARHRGAPSGTAAAPTAAPPRAWVRARPGGARRDRGHAGLAWHRRGCFHAWARPIRPQAPRRGAGCASPPCAWRCCPLPHARSAAGTGLAAEKGPEGGAPGASHSFPITTPLGRGGPCTPSNHSSETRRGEASDSSYRSTRPRVLPAAPAAPRTPPGALLPGTELTPKHPALSLPRCPCPFLGVPVPAARCPGGHRRPHTGTKGRGEKGAGGGKRRWVEMGGEEAAVMGNLPHSTAPTDV